MAVRGPSWRPRRCSIMAKSAPGPVPPGHCQRRLMMLGSVSILVTPLVAQAQQSGTIRRIGFLSLAAAESSVSQQLQQALRATLRAVGYEEGKNLLIEWRWGNDVIASLPALAADLVDRKVEVIIAVLNDEIAAVMRATRSVPIVMMFGHLPVEQGFVTSLSHPGGNVTGSTWNPPENAPKLLQLLKEATPTATRIAALWNPTFPGARLYGSEFERAAPGLGVQLSSFEATRPDEVLPAMAKLAASKPDGFFIFLDPVVASHLAEVTKMAIDHRLASISGANSFTAAGGLISYAPDTLENIRRTIGKVDQILKGAKPAEIPVEQPTRYILTINLKTARAIGAVIPKSMLLRADKIIE